MPYIAPTKAVLTTLDFAHISDPNERRRLALAEIDKAPFGWCMVYSSRHP
jgi:hypothetical protein